MVRIDRIFSHSLLLSVLAASSLSVVGTPLEVIPIDEIDMTEATLALLPERVRTDGMEERVALFYDKEGFFVRTSGDDVRVQRYDTDKLFHGRKVEDMARYAALGKFKLSKFDNGEYAVHSCGELKGGGLVLGAIGYWGTKVVCYTPIIVAGCLSGVGFPAVCVIIAEVAPAVESAAVVVGAAGLGAGPL